MANRAGKNAPRNAQILRRLPTREESNEKLHFSKGVAICENRILTDTLFCRFRDETFEFPSSELIGLTLGFYERDYVPGSPVQVKVAKLRKLKERIHGKRK